MTGRAIYLLGLRSANIRARLRRISVRLGIAFMTADQDTNLYREGACLLWTCNIIILVQANANTTHTTHSQEYTVQREIQTMPTHHTLILSHVRLLVSLFCSSLVPNSGW